MRNGRSACISSTTKFQLSHAPITLTQSLLCPVLIRSLATPSIAHYTPLIASPTGILSLRGRPPRALMLMLIEHAMEADLPVCRACGINVLFAQSESRLLMRLRITAREAQSPPRPSLRSPGPLCTHDAVTDMCLSPCGHRRSATF